MFVSAFLFLFQFVYNLFAHGVSSLFMTYAFLIPFVMGAVVYFISSFLEEGPVISGKLWQMSIATLTTGSILKGIFDIYGSTVSLLTVYLVVGAALAFIASIIYIIRARGW